MLGKISTPTETLDDLGYLLLEFSDGSAALMNASKTELISLSTLPDAGFKGDQATRYLKAYFPKQLSDYEYRIKNTRVDLIEPVDAIEQPVQTETVDRPAQQGAPIALIAILGYLLFM